MRGFIVIQKGNQIGDCFAEYFAVREALMAMIEKNSHRIIMVTDFQFVLNATHVKVFYPASYFNL